MASIMTLRDPAVIWKNLQQTYHATSEASIDSKRTK